METMCIFLLSHIVHIQVKYFWELKHLVTGFKIITKIFNFTKLKGFKFLHITRIWYKCFLSFTIYGNYYPLSAALCCFLSAFHQLLITISVCIQRRVFVIQSKILLNKVYLFKWHYLFRITRCCSNCELPLLFCDDGKGWTVLNKNCIVSAINLRECDKMKTHHIWGLIC